MTKASDPLVDGRTVRLWLGPLLVAGGALSIGFAPIGLRLGLETMGPQAIAFWRYVFGVPMTLGLVLLVHRRFPVRPNRFVILAGTFFALEISLWHLSLTHTTVANATFLVSLGNLSVGLLALMFLEEKLTPNWAVAVLIALFGAALLTQGGGAEALGDVGGDVLAIGAAILVSFYLLCAKIARRDISGLDVLFWVTLTELCVGGAVTFFSGENFMPADLSGFQAPLLLAVIVQCLGQGLIIAGIGRTPAAIAGILLLIQPVAAAAVSWKFFAEPLVVLQVLGAGLILLGVGWSQTGARPKEVS